MNFEEAKGHFARIMAANPNCGGLDVVDISTPSMFKRHSITGAVAILGAKTYTMEPRQVEKWRRALRELGGSEVVGIDIEDGLNVDYLADLCHPDFCVRYPDLIGRFGYVICGALLEHVKNPFLAANNICSIIKPGGHIFYNGPWVWGYHPYPDDYYRYTISGVKELFPGIDWKEWCYSSTNGKFGVRLKDIKFEKKAFQLIFPEDPEPKTLSALLSNRAMTYLNVNAIGSKPYLG